jgi:hypothetical protein
MNKIAAPCVAGEERLLPIEPWVLPVGVRSDETIDVEEAMPARLSLAFR